MHKQTILSIRDLRFASCVCRQCNTTVTLDFDAEFQSPRRPFLVPRDCPRCGNPFDSAVGPALEALQKAYKSLINVEGAVTFTAPSPDPL